MSQSNTFSLLALCARTQGHPTQYQHLREQAAKVTDWNPLPAQAENHGLTPLVYAHLQTAGVSVPSAPSTKLRTQPE